MKLSKRIKLLYGFGFPAQGIKDGLFQIFLFFYFSQVLGLGAGLTGLATIIALFFTFRRMRLQNVTLELTNFTQITNNY